MVATGYPNNGQCQVIDMSSSTTTCSNLPSYPTSVYGAAGGVINGSPIICGGNSGSPRSLRNLQGSCYIFDKNENTWKLHCNMKSRRVQPAISVVKGTLFVSGGGGDGDDLTSTEIIYSNGTVESGPHFPGKRHGHCMVTLPDGKVMIIGAASPNPINRNAVIIDPANTNNSYTDVPSTNYIRKRAACALFNSPLHDGRPVVLVAGGDSTTTAEVYDYTVADQWQTSIHLIMSNM